MSDPHELEPFFSYWMSALTERGLAVFDLDPRLLHGWWC